MTEIQMIPVGDIAIDTAQSRRGHWEDDDVDQWLIDSIQGMGLIYEIIVRSTTTEKYGGTTKKPWACIVGSRRLNALIRAGKKEIACKVLDLTDIEAIAMSFSENIGRKNLTEYELMIALVTWRALLEREGRNEEQAVKEIADTAFGGKTGRIQKMLQVAQLPKRLQILIKEPRRRTKSEKHMLREHGIDSDFKMNFETLNVIGKINGELKAQKLSSSERVEKVLEIIREFSFDGKTWLKQFEILGSIRDKLREGKIFDIVMREVKEGLKIFTVSRIREVRVKIPSDYELRHKEACARERKEGNQLVLDIYMMWLDGRLVEKIGRRT